MGFWDKVIDRVLNRKTDTRAEQQIVSLENALKKAEKSPDQKTYQRAIELKKIVDQKYKEIKKIKDQETFDLKAHKIADMAMYAKTYLEYGKDHNERQRWQYVFDDRLRALEYTRPGNEQDMQERRAILETIVPQLEQTISESEGLLFHSTSMPNAASIIENLSLSSSADRYDGYDASTDGRGRISVADISGLNWSTSYWLCTTTETMPCGVLFVLKENYEGDYDKGQHQMDSIDFNKNPNQLEYIISTSENMDKLKSLMAEKGFTTDKVITFEQFLEIEQEKNKERLENVKSQEIEDKTQYIDQDKILNEPAIENTQNVELNLEINNQNLEER